MNCRGPHRALRVLLSIASLTIAASLANADPPTDYMLHCRGCHGPDGAGVPGSVPDMRGLVGRFARLPEGRIYLMRVPGVSQSELDDAATAALLNWLVRELGGTETPADFRPYTEQEVAAHRRPPLVDVVRVRAELLAKIVGAKGD